MGVVVSLRTGGRCGGFPRPLAGWSWSRGEVSRQEAGAQRGTDAGNLILGGDIEVYQDRIHAEGTNARGRGAPP
ncbi:unnamed protein product [Choristocarpus tenellus]